MMNPLNVLVMLAVLSPIDTRPGLGDLHRFPSSEQCWAAYDFRQQHREWLEPQARYYPFRNQYADWLCELNQLGNIWETLWRAHGSIQRDGKSYWPNANYQRDCLNQLRELLGDDNYYSGWFPPMLPVWRFREIEWQGGCP